MRWKMPLAMATLAFAGVANAGVTALTTIPIADVLGHREIQFGYAGFGNERNIDPKTYHYAWTTIGLFDRFEVAYGDDLEGGQTFHAKVLLFEDPHFHNSAFSVGFMNWQDYDTTPFAVGRMEFGNLRLHGGWMNDGVDRGIWGADFPIFGDWTVMLEFTSGPGSIGWASVNIPVRQIEGLNLMVGAGIPSERRDGYQHMFSVYYNTRF